ncbi:MAG: helix-turn-helix domain-containing protein [Elusimicrobia bacterium]|nr:helix-turn-helix domain-containing protein [Elusimicrobiota bacterium]
MKQTKEIMSLKELAEYMGLSVATIYRGVEKRQIPAAKVGKQWRFHKDTIDLWLAGKMTAGFSDPGYLQELQIKARLAEK